MTTNRIATKMLGPLLMAQSGIYLLSILGIIVMALGMGVANAAMFKLVPNTFPGRFA
jgi:NNP family nitrate/nitrite transporter-like MFS transporter